MLRKCHSPARILFVNQTCDLGDPSLSLLKLLKFIGQEHEVAVVAPGNGELFMVLEQMGIPYHRAGPYGLTRSAIPWLCQLVGQGRFDLIYSNNYSTDSRNALIAAKLTRRPYVWHIRETLEIPSHEEFLRDGRNAHLFRLSDPEYLVACVMSLVDQPQQAETIARMAWEQSAECTYDVRARRILELADEVWERRYSTKGVRS